MYRAFAFLIFVCIFYLEGFIYAQEKYGCQKNECTKYTCVDYDTCYGRLIRNGSLLQCGCCDVCVKYQELGAECTMITHSALPREECGEGLTCDNSKDPDKPTCVYAQTKCVQTQIEMTREKETTGKYTMGMPEPKCDTFGDYEPVQCKEGMKCYCVDINGNRIFGLAPYSERSKMNCSCSRDYETFKRHMKDPDEPNQFMRCAPNGDYFHTQCTDDKCYCVNPAGVLTKIPTNKKEIRKLMCSDEIVEEFDSPCIKEYMETMKKIAEFSGLVVGLEPPSCDLDGSYSPVQCSGFECYCVNKQGQKSTESIVRNSDEARTMKCGCFREKALLKEAEKSLIIDILTKYECKDNGNYLPFQCTNAVCFCVDEIEGFQTGPPNLYSKRDNLPCYHRDYDKFN